ncbi:YkvA family protein [Vaginisenegalia massiliensis]|uniref:YkvA family protein n=1 Tax=Vaginisenegalia massiliensis TaxID=2058294 RepID=UPI000F52B939|nr:DUF1232 domain-containing protein [Vaginisenegalia massiliensis]
MKLKDKAQQIKRDLPKLPLALKHPDTPWLAKGLAIVTLIYALSPVDLIPDFIPVLGYLDDLIILPMLLMLTIHFIPDEVWDQLQQESQEFSKEKLVKRWYYALPILLIWLGIGYWIYTWWKA